MLTSLTIIIPTKDRAEVLAELLESLRHLDGLAEAQPEIIVADNGSRDETQAILKSAAADFFGRMKVIEVTRPGKSAAVNEALRLACGDYVAFLDDDVVVDRGWLRALQDFIWRGEYQVGQGRIRLRSPEADDPETRRLISRYRTIPHLEHGPGVREVRALIGANFFVARDILNRIGGFDERLGPGAAGTSEDVELANRLLRSGIRIGYARDCIAYHQIDRSRLCEAYFQHIHRRQGISRLMIKDRSLFIILSSLGRAYLQYFYYSLIGNERRRYRSLGRVFHYSEMAKVKRRGVSDPWSVKP